MEIIMSNEDRPWCCPQTSCKPLYVFGELDSYSDRKPGDSFICFGKLKKAVIRQVDGVVHKNDLSTCNYVAGRGIFRYFENRDDWEGLLYGYKRALEIVDGPIKEKSDWVKKMEAEWDEQLLPCPMCGGKAKYDSEHIIGGQSHGVVYCTQCAIQTDYAENPYNGMALTAWNMRGGVEHDFTQQPIKEV